MNLTRPLYCLAIAVAMVSSLANQVVAQFQTNVEACEAFTAAIEAEGDTTIVTGITAEETVDSPFLGFGSLIFDNMEILSGQAVLVETPQLTIPSGTLRLPESDGPFPANTLISVDGTIDGAPVTSQGIINFANGDPLNLQPFQTLVFEPNLEFGEPRGICFTFVGDPNLSNLSSISPFISIFDGDTLVEQIDINSGDLSFIAEPGQTFTRVEYPAFDVLDISVAFRQAPVVAPEVSSQECLAGIATEIGELAEATTDVRDAYKLNVAFYALNFAAQDRFYQEGGNRLTRRGGNVFTGAAYAISYLESTSVEGTEDFVDRILNKLEQIVDDEIDYALANDGRIDFIESAEAFSEIAQWIDEDLDNPVIATIAYKLAWAKAFLATY